MNLTSRIINNFIKIKAMKKSLTFRTLALLLTFFVTGIGYSQHFTPVWTGNPYQSMAFIIQNATIDGVAVEAGDEIAVFDVTSGGTSICVGAVVLTGTPAPSSPASFPAAHEEIGGDGFITGHTIVYKIWDNSESEEISIVAATYFGPPFDEVYTPQGSALVTSLAGSSAISTTAATLNTCAGTVAVPVEVSSLTDISVISLILNYDNTNLTFTGTDNVNPVLTGLTTSENNGEITIWLSITPAINMAAGTLLDLVFTAGTVTTQTTANLTWDDVNSYYENGGGTTMEAVFNNGVVTIDPLPGDAGDITGAIEVCQGTLAESYQVAAIPYATTYNWELNPAIAGTLNGGGTDITIDFSATYSGQVTLSVYGTNTCGDGTSSSLTIDVIAEPTADAGTDATICEDAPYTLAGVASNHQSVLWQSSGDGSFNDATLLNAIYTPGANDISAGTATLTLTANAISPCAVNATDNMVITIQELPTAGAGTDATICEDDTYTLSGTATNQLSILWSTAGDGTFDDATALTATYTPGVNDKVNGFATLTITSQAIAPCGSAASDNMVLTIQGLPEADAGQDAVICETDSYTLSGSVTNPESVMWSTAGDGSFDNASSLTAIYTPGATDISNGSVTLTLSVTSVSPCTTGTSDEMTITIQHAPTANAGTDATICSDVVYNLSGTASNQQSILWSTSGDGTFDDATALTAAYTPGTADISSGSAILTITAYATTPCGVNATDNLTLTITEAPSAYAGADDAVCETTPVYTLSGIASNEASILWTGGDGTFDDATLLNATYTAGAGDLTAGSVTLTLTAYPNSPCAANAIDNMVLTYAVLPTADAGPDDEICLNTPSYQVAGATASNYTTVLWTTSGDGSFADATLLNPVYSPGTNDRTAGTVDLTMTATSVSPCDVSDVMTLTFAVLPTANAGADASICEDATYMLSGTATDYSALLWTTSGDGSFDDATSLTAIYTPGTNDITSGSATLTLTSYASFPCVDNDSDDMVLNIGLLPIANAGADDEICLNTSDYLIAGATAANQSSVLWTTSGDGTFNNATLVNPTYTPGSGDIANFSVTLTMTANATTPCSANDVDSMVLNFALLPTANAGPDGEVCESDNYMLSGSYQHASSVLWSTSGDGTFDDATSESAIYTPGSSDITNGNVDLTITAFAQLPCSNDATDVMTLNIMLLPIVDAGIDDAICASSDFFTTNGSTAGDVSTTLWTTSGDGSFDDATQLITNYNPGPNDLTNEVVTLTLTASPVAPCANTTFDQMELTIQPTPTSNAGSDATICENETHTLNGSATNYDHVYWTTFGDGTFNDPFLMNATYTPGSQDIISGSVTLEMFAYSIVPCYGEIGDEMLLTIQSLPQANAGDNGETCFDSPYQLNGSANNYADIFWSTSGDGTFDDIALLNALYTPGPNDIENGTVDITLTATPSTSACSGNATDSMTLSINDYPDQPQIPEGPTAIDLDLVTSSEYTIAEVPNAISYEWILEPATAGTIEGTGLTGTAYWSSDYTGIAANIHVVAINNCGETASENLGISLSPVGISTNTLNDARITLAPNPSTGRFNITIEGISEEVDLTISNSNGQVVYQEKLINTLDQSIHPVDISANPSGIYYLKFVSNDVVETRKVIIK